PPAYNLRDVMTRFIRLLSLLFWPPAPPTPHPLSLHDALPICHLPCPGQCNPAVVVHHSLDDGERGYGRRVVVVGDDASLGLREGDRKSTRLNSSHLVISYAVFCLKKKKKIIDMKCEQHRTERI